MGCERGIEVLPGLGLALSLGLALKLGFSLNFSFVQYLGCALNLGLVQRLGCAGLRTTRWACASWLAFATRQTSRASGTASAVLPSRNSRVAVRNARAARVIERSSATAGRGRTASSPPSGAAGEAGRAAPDNRAPPPWAHRATSARTEMGEDDVVGNLERGGVLRRAGDDVEHERAPVEVEIKTLAVARRRGVDGLAGRFVVGVEEDPLGGEPLRRGDGERIAVLETDAAVIIPYLVMMEAHLAPVPVRPVMSTRSLRCSSASTVTIEPLNRRLSQWVAPMRRRSPTAMSSGTGALPRSGW